MALQSQINPHFLFNTLETIRMKAVSAGTSDVADMVYILATLFRNSIDGGTFIPISAELEYCKLYLQLFKIKYGEIFTFNIEINNDIMNYSMVKFTLQPIIENYLFHGMKQDSKNNAISIKGFISDSNILFVISDNGIGISKEKLDRIEKTLEDNTHKQTNTIGLSNVNERLKIIYGSSYGISISSELDKGTCVKIRIPAKKMEDIGEYVQSTSGR
jgi:two-component system sensor histidine kinase YesM